MTEEGHTDVTDFLPEIHDREDGTFWITLNPYYASLPILENGFIGFEFRHKMSMTEAHEFVKLFHEKIKSISYTKLTGVGKREPVKPLVKKQSSPSRS
jgi:hypothetical protein